MEPSAIVAIKEWSDVVKNIFTVIAVIVGGVWAVWHWGNPKRRNAAENAESLDGSLAVRANFLEGESLLVTVVATWNNRGDFIVSLDPKRCEVTVFEVPKDLGHGRCEISDSWRVVAVHRPFEKQSRLELEPKTESQLSAHFVLPRERLYFFLWEIASCSKEKYKWKKDLVWRATS